MSVQEQNFLSSFHHANCVVNVFSGAPRPCWPWNSIKHSYMATDRVKILYLLNGKSLRQTYSDAMITVHHAMGVVEPVSLGRNENRSIKVLSSLYIFFFLRYPCLLKKLKSW